MQKNPFKLAFPGLLLTLFLCWFQIFPGSAVYVIANPNDPYARTCVFDAAPGEPIVYLTDYQGQDGMKSYRFSDLMIGEYIRDTYPDIWEKLSPEDQEFCNSRAAVWLAGAEEPALLDIVQKLLWENQAATGTLFLQTDELTSPAPAVSPETGFSSRFMEVRSTGSSGEIFDSGNLITAWQATWQAHLGRTLP